MTSKLTPVRPRGARAVRGKKRSGEMVKRPSGWICEEPAAGLDPIAIDRPLSEGSTTKAVKGTINAVKGTTYAANGTTNAANGTATAVKGTTYAANGTTDAVKGTTNGWAR